MTKKNLLVVSCNMIKAQIENIHYDNDESLMDDVNRVVNYTYDDVDICKEYFDCSTILIRKIFFTNYDNECTNIEHQEMSFYDYWKILFKIFYDEFNSNSQQYNIYQKVNELLVVSPIFNIKN
jgi:hypothetical protein